MADAISIQELIDARTDAKTLEEAVNGDAVTTVLSRLGETYPTLSNAINQIDSKLDSADAQIKQGITNLFENGGLPATPFATKALMTASTLVDGKYAMVTEDADNNGLYVKTAGAWVKSGYDPLAQAKSYSDSTKIPKTDLQVIYTNGNAVGQKTIRVPNYGLNNTTSWIFSSDGAYESLIIPVVEGVTYYLYNAAEVYTKGGTGAAALFPDNPATNAAVRDGAIKTTLGGGVISVVTHTDGKKYGKVTAVKGANYLVLNSKFQTYTEWAVHADKPSTSMTSGSPMLFSLSDALAIDKNTQIILSEISNGSRKNGELATSEAMRVNMWLSTSGAFSSDGGKGWTVFNTPARAGDVFYYYAEYKDTYSTSSSRVVFSKYETSTNGTEGVIWIGNPTQTNIPNLYRIEAPDNPEVRGLFINVKISDYDITESFSAQRSYYDFTLRGVETPNTLDRLSETYFEDSKARKDIGIFKHLAPFRFLDKPLWLLGDSITHGTPSEYGTYAKYIADGTGAIVKNYGSSGGTAARAADIVMIGSEAPRRDTSGISWSEKDFTNLSCVTLMIGANDTVGTNLGDIGAIPEGQVTDYDDPNEYWALFPNRYTTNIALIIEYILWKNPDTEIYLIKSVYLGRDIERIKRTHEHLDALGEYYSLPVINATYESGLGVKGMAATKNIYTYDGTHLNRMGNKVFGNFLATKILAGG